MLIDIVKKNAIMQIDFALDAERQHGKTPSEAIYEGCIIRFRPIMIMIMAALLGVVADRARRRRRRREQHAERSTPGSAVSLTPSRRRRGCRPCRPADHEPLGAGRAGHLDLAAEW